MTKNETLFPQLVLVFVTFLWGGTFLTLQIALQWADPVVIVAMRFSLATLMFLVMIRSQLFRIKKTDWIAGSVVGLCIFAVYTLQTIGLETIPSSTSAFLTGLYVAFVPLLQWTVLRKRLSWPVIVGVVMAFVGMTLLANPFQMTFANSIGEWITILSAFICAIEILTVGAFAPKCNPLHLAFTQMLTVAVLANLTLLGHTPVRETQYTWGLLACIAGLAACVAFIQFVIGWAMKKVEALRATLIYSLEPVFAGIIGWLAGERLGLTGLTGGALIVLAVLISAYRPRNKKA
ncbi:MAG: DMT family transporter [Burkholderiaceae bacterium]|nr:DMT family transporter [Burkholderiaceae bacterium]